LIEKLSASSGKIIGFQLRGRLSEADYTDILMPIIERGVQEYTKVRVLIQVENFEGWTVGGAWEDLKNWPKFRYIERMAIVGDESWDQWMNWMLRIFAVLTHTDLRFFRMDRLTEAWSWLRAEN
jgi:hypothetical protein